MKFEKKVTSFIMLVIIIGLTVVMSIHIVSAETNKLATATNSVATQENLLPTFIVNPLSENAENAVTQNPLGSSVNITYAYVNLHQAGGNETFTLDGAMIRMVVNITLTSEVNLEHADGKVEFYVFHLYSEKGSIANMTQSILVEKSPLYVSKSKNQGSPISGLRGNIVCFTDGTEFDANKIIGDNIGGGGQSFNIHNYPNRTHFVVGPGVLVTSLRETHAQVLADLRSAQALYIDVTRILGITCQEDADQMVTSTLFSNEVLCHIELTKVDDRFGYGAYTGTEYNYPLSEYSLVYSIQTDMNYVYLLVVTCCCFVVIGFVSVLLVLRQLKND